MRHLIVLASLTTLALTTSAPAATLNKCIDAKGLVTYSNLPCRNAREVRTLEIDPAPPADPVRPQAVEAQAARELPAKPATKPTASAKDVPTLRLETQRTNGKPAAQTSAQRCDALTDKLGQVFDKMDQARRKGYTQAQMDKWNQEVKDLERQKQQSGCF